MATTIEKKEKGLYFLISIIGDFNIRSLFSIRENIEEALLGGHIYIAFNLNKTTFIDSSGIGLLANVNQKLMAKGGSLFLIAVSDDIRHGLETSGFLKSIPHFQSIEEADLQIG